MRKILSNKPVRQMKAIGIENKNVFFKKTELIKNCISFEGGTNTLGLFVMGSDVTNSGIVKYSVCCMHTDGCINIISDFELYKTKKEAIEFVKQIMKKFLELKEEKHICIIEITSIKKYIVNDNIMVILKEKGLDRVLLEMRSEI